MTAIPSKVLLFGRLSYPHLFAEYFNPEYPKTPPGYSLALIFSKDSMAIANRELKERPDIISNPQVLRHLALALAQQEFPIGHPRRPVDFEDREYFYLIPRDGGKPDKVDRAGYGPGTYYCSCKNNRKADEKFSEGYDPTAFLAPPSLIDRYRRKITQETPDLLYAGCYVLVQANLYAYGKKGSGKRGIDLGLLSVMHFADGERIGGSVANLDDFPELEMPAGFEDSDGGDLDI